MDNNQNDYNNMMPSMPPAQQPAMQPGMQPGMQPNMQQPQMICVPMCFYCYPMPQQVMGESYCPNNMMYDMNMNDMNQMQMPYNPHGYGMPEME